MANDLSENEVFAVNLAALAREIAMDVFDVPKILEIHRLSDAEWQKISANQKFQEMLRGLVSEWQSATNTKERVRVKAATGLEMQLEIYIRDISDPKIPLAQRVEAGKFLARLGELDGSQIAAGGGGAAFQINLNIGTHHIEKTPIINGTATRLSEGAIPE
jgi:hypothetical protein